MGFQFRQGQVVSINEHLIKFLPETNPQRKPKKTRHMVVVMDTEPALDPKWDVLLACLIHSDHKRTTSWDVHIPAQQTNVPRLDTESWIVIPSLQPILKADVKADLGILGLDIVAEVYGRLVEYTGMADFMKQFQGRP